MTDELAVPPQLVLGRRKRKREADRVAEAVEALTRALQPLDQLARVRVLSAVAALFDVGVKFTDGTSG